jgi:hypothetical protein
VGSIAVLDAGGDAAKTSLTIRLEITMMGASSDFQALLIHSFDHAFTDAPGLRQSGLVIFGFIRTTDTEGLVSISRFHKRL